MDEQPNQIDAAWDEEERRSVPEWTTRVGWGAPVGKIVAGYPLIDLIGNVSYAQALYLVLKQELPDRRTTAMLEACLTTLIDSGFRNTVAIAARFAASANPEPINAIAAGLLGVGRHTAGAQRYVVALINRGMELQRNGMPAQQAVEHVLDDFAAQQENIPGLGTKMHKSLGHDPRATRLVDIAEDLGYTSDVRYEFFQRIHRELQGRKQRAIVVNADGAMGAVLAAMGFDEYETAALEVAVMLPSIMGHVVEEIREGQPLRYLAQAHLRYNGQSKRPVPEDLMFGAFSRKRHEDGPAD